VISCHITLADTWFLVLGYCAVVPLIDKYLLVLFQYFDGVSWMKGNASSL